MITRKVNWPELLHQEISAAANRDFQYGVHDCCTFAAIVFKALTTDSLDLRKGMKKYRSAAGSVRALNTAGFKSPEHLVEVKFAELDIPEIHPAAAKRGDIVVTLDEDGYPALGVCVGTHCAFAANGLEYKKYNEVIRAWHYG